MARISKTHLRKLKILLKRLRSNVIDHEQIYPCSWPFSSLIDATSDELIVIEKLLKGEQGE